MVQKLVKASENYLSKIMVTYKTDDDQYIAVYFQSSKKIVTTHHHHQTVTMRWFTRKKAFLSGMKQVLVLLHPVIAKLKIKYIPDQTIIEPLEPVLLITGPYHLFAYLEGRICGILAHMTSVASLSHELTTITKKEIIYMNDRSTLPITQPEEGLAAYEGGIKTFVTKAQIQKINDPQVQIVGTIPHSLIAYFDGDIIKTCQAFQKSFPNEKLIALVDFHNDVVTDSLKVATTFPELYAIRIDTAPNMLDQYFHRQQMTDHNNYGVSMNLVVAVRQVLNKAGFNKIKIIVSGNFDIAKVKQFEQNHIPVDAYGIGKLFSKPFYNFTGDLIKVDGRPCAKAGRREWKTSKHWKEIKDGV